MADTLDVKSYLACWFQLGKGVITSTPTGQRCLKPHRVLAIEGLSEEFETCWRRIAAQPEQCYLEDTDETIADLLSDRWQIDACSRCGLPVPLIQTSSNPPGPCPCAYLSNWPNDQTIPPRVPGEHISQTAQFNQIRQRLDQS